MPEINSDFVRCSPRNFPDLLVVLLDKAQTAWH